MPATPPKIMLVTGMSGAGRSTALNALEDLGWEVVYNLPLSLLERLLATQTAMGAPADRPLAVGVDARTRGFNPQALLQRIQTLREVDGLDIVTLFLDCNCQELERRYTETRRRHPLAQDRPAEDGIARERELLSDIRRWADIVMDTTALSSHDLQADIRRFFTQSDTSRTTLSVLSFGFSRGLPRNADLVFDMRFLQNPHWISALRPLNGQDSAVAEYVAQDPVYAAALEQITSLLSLLLPRYEVEGKAYVTIAFGCTGGRHRSVHVAETIAQRLRLSGFSPSVTHRDLQCLPLDSLEGNSVSAPNA